MHFSLHDYETNECSQTYSLTLITERGRHNESPFKMMICNITLNINQLNALSIIRIIAQQLIISSVMQNTSCLSAQPFLWSCLLMLKDVLCWTEQTLTCLHTVLFFAMLFSVLVPVSLEAQSVLIWLLIHQQDDWCSSKGLDHTIRPLSFGWLYFDLPYETV